MINISAITNKNEQYISFLLKQPWSNNPWFAVLFDLHQTIHTTSLILPIIEFWPKQIFHKSIIKISVKLTKQTGG